MLPALPPSPRWPALHLRPALRLALRWLAPMALLAAATGCAPEIGDDCTTSIDCSQLGDRLCDTSQPDGYCTIFNCEPDQCPEEAVCIAFGFDIDPACSGV